MRRVDKNGWVALTLNLKVGDPHQLVIAETLEAMEESQGATMSAVIRQLVEAALGMPQQSPTDALRSEVLAMFAELETRLLGKVMSMRNMGEMTEDAAEYLKDEVSRTFNLDDVPKIALAAAKSTFKPGLRLGD